MVATHKNELGNNDQDDDFDPSRLSSPQVFLLSMLIFLVISGFVAAILYRQVSSAFLTNPGLNGLIFGVLVVGVILAFMQVIRLFREVRWVNSFREGRSAKDPVLLAPMKAMLSRNSSSSLSTTSMRSILDSIATRLDENRDISRYLIGLLVFLGLLGTFWGLLQTIGSIGDTIQSLNPSSGNTADVLDSLKNGLAAPLDGMGTAFSSSLFGLAGSLVLGFLDLQSGRAQNRFYIELENWLSSVTDVDSDFSSAKMGSSDEMQAMAQSLERLQNQGAGAGRSNASIAQLAEGISGLVKNMRTEQQMMRTWIEEQAKDRAAMHETLAQISNALARSKARAAGPKVTVHKAPTPTRDVNKDEEQ